jgi:hypothetical protein
MQRLIVIAAALAATTVSTSLAAGDQAQRRSSTGAPDAAGRPAPVQVPRHPYAGAWDGRLTLTDAAGAETTSTLSMNFSVKDGARQAYSGETRLGAQAAVTHTNISSATDAAPADAAGAATMRRSSGAPAGGASASGPSASTPDLDTLGAGTHAMLVHHSPTQSMLLCDQGGRCVTLATLTWEERDRRGRRYSYAAKLTGADTITGTVTVTDAGGSTSTGKFVLARQKH